MKKKNKRNNIKFISLLGNIFEYFLESKFQSSPKKQKKKTESEQEGGGHANEMTTQRRQQNKNNKRENVTAKEPKRVGKEGAAWGQQWVGICF